MNNSPELGSQPQSSERAAQESVSGAIPSQVESTLGPETLETVEQMKPASKGFFGRLFDKIKSSDVVQNISDRYQVWRDERLAQRQQKYVDGAICRQKAGQSLVDQAQRASERSQANLSRLEEIMTKSGKAISDEVRVKAMAEQARFSEMKSEYEASVQQTAGQIKEIHSTQDSFLEKARQARGRLDGRLEAKVEANNQALEGLRQCESRADLQIASNEAEREKLGKIEDELETLFEALDRSDSIYGEVQQQIKEARKKRVKLEEIHDQYTRGRDSVRGRIAKLEGKNSDLSAKREKILPASERPAQRLSSDKTPLNERVAPAPVWGGEEVARVENQPDYEAILDWERRGPSDEPVLETKEASEADERSVEPTTEKNQPEISQIEIKPSTARRGEIVITTTDGRVRKLTHKYSDIGPCIMEIDSQGKCSTTPLDQLTDEDLKPFRTISGDRLKLLGLGTEITSRLEAMEGEENDFSIGNVTFDWNKMVGKKSGLQIELPRFINPTMGLEDSFSAKEYLLKALAKKLLQGQDQGNVAKLSKKIVAMVDKFLKG